MHKHEALDHARFLIGQLALDLILIHMSCPFMFFLFLSFKFLYSFLYLFMSSLSTHFISKLFIPPQLRNSSFERTWFSSKKCCIICFFFLAIQRSPALYHIMSCWMRGVVFISLNERDTNRDLM